MSGQGTLDQGCSSQIAEARQSIIDKAVELSDRADRHVKSAQRDLLGIMALIVLGLVAIIFSRELARLDIEAYESIDVERSKRNAREIQEQIQKVATELDANTKLLAAPWMQEPAVDAHRIHALVTTDASRVAYAAGSKGSIFVKTGQKGWSRQERLVGDADLLTASALPGTDDVAFGGTGGNLVFVKDGVWHTKRVDKFAITSISWIEKNKIYLFTTEPSFRVVSIADGSVSKVRISPFTQDSFFIDKNTGWAVGDYGKISKTQDGGITWSEQISGTQELLTSISFSTLQPEKGWVAGANGTLLSTVNAGASWTAIKPRHDVSYFDVEALPNADGCWVAGGKGIFFKIGQGDSVAEPKNLPSASTVLTMSLDENGKPRYVADDNGKILSNGEDSLAQQASGLKEQLSQLRKVEADLANRVDGDNMVAAETGKTTSENDWFFHIATNSTRVAVIVVLLLLVQILVQIYKHKSRLACFYRSRSDALKLYADTVGAMGMQLETLISHLSADHIEYSSTSASPQVSAIYSDLSSKLLNSQYRKTET